MARRPSHKAGGFCGWTTRECKALEKLHYQAAADFFNAMESESDNRLPKAMRYLPKVTLVKKDTGKPLDTRQIGLNSVWYSVYGKIRYAQLGQWRAEWGHKNIMGARAGKTSED
eukprot:4963353-Alexandrium_andersonii.AAC.1